MAKANIKNLRYGDVVQITERKGNRVVCVVAGIRQIQRGKRAGTNEYKLAPIDKPSGNAYAYRVYGEKLLSVATGRYTKKQIAAALGKEDATRTEVQGKRAERVERGRAAIGDIEPGDEVFVRYRDAAPRWEKVLVVNRRAGKIGIPNPRALPLPSSDFEFLLRQALGSTNKRGPKPYRLIHPDSIEDVRSQQKD